MSFSFFRFSAIVCLLLSANQANAQIVVSQVYGGGGNTGATYNRDYVELFNRGAAPVSLGGLTVQYASATGTGNFAVGATLPNVLLAPGQYHLVGMSSGANGAALPAVDTSGTSSMATAAGKVALVNGTAALACNGGSAPCSAAQQAQIVDLVGYGSANFFEGTAAAPTLSATLAAFRAVNGCTDTANNSADFAAATPTARNSATTAFVCGGGSTPLVSVNDVSAVEGDSGTTQFFFAFGLSQPAGPGGVSVQYATADGTATAGSDYVASNGTLTIPEGSNSVAFSVTVNGDTTTEPNETFFVNIVSATGANIADGQGLGTIQNDDVSVVQIHDIQGPGLTSPINGATVVTEGIVTAQKFNNGFFLQTADANVDADPNTSQGIFVFTSTAPPATAAVGNRVRVAGTVTEFTPSTNLNQLSITEIVSVTSIQVLSTGNPLPTAVVLNDTLFGPGVEPGTAERLEGMRVFVPNARVVAASDGNIAESSATSTTTGVFYAVLNFVNRPFREPGIGALDAFPIPSGKTPPRFDTNPERIMVRSRGQVGATALAVDVGATIENMTGVMDYFSGTWALLPDAGSGIVVGGKLPSPVIDATASEVTVASANLLRFFDEINDSNGAPTLTAAALDKRLTKTSLAICDYLKTPDILGVVEVENLRVLGLLADRINSTCPTAPAYVPYLVQGNDVGGINVGFLVSNRPVGVLNRVEVLEVTQFGKTTPFANPDGSTALLNDRPPLMLRARVHHSNGASYPITVFVNHLRSLNGLDDTAPGSSGWPTEGDRVRNKRGRQAEFLASLVHARQIADPNERIVLLGDFNAFQFNDGYVDVMGIVRGDESPENEVITAIDSPIATPLVDGSDLIFDPAEKYSYVFEGNTQTLDHVVVNEAVAMSASGLSVDHARINADFGVHHFGVSGTPLRVSDHDPVRLRIAVPDFASADLIASAFAIASEVGLGDPARFVASIDNAGPDDAGPLSIALVFDALVTPTVTPSALPPDDQWTCAAPAQGATRTTVVCTSPSLSQGGSVGFEIEVPTDAALANRALRMDVAVASQTPDPANADNEASATVDVRALADLSVVASGPAAPVDVGGTATFTAELRNSGPQSAPFASMAFVFDARVAPAVSAPSGWNCAAPVQDAATTTVTCTHPDLPSGENALFSLAVPADGPQQSDWSLRMAVAADSQWPDSDRTDNSAVANAQIRVFADLDTVAFAITTGRVAVGGTAELEVGTINNGPATVSPATLTLSFDARVAPTIVAPAPWVCGAATQTAASTTVLCTIAELTRGAPARSFAIRFVNDGSVSSGRVTLTATMSSAVADPFLDNNQTSATVLVDATADLVAAVSASPASVSVGGTATYTATLTNAGPAAINSIHANFAFDALVAPTLQLPAGWNCNAPTQDASNTYVACVSPLSPIAPGDSVTIQASFVADAALAGRRVSMQAIALSEYLDPDETNNVASASVAVVAALGNADMSSSLLGGPVVGGTITVGPTVRAGGAIVYVVPVRNNGPNGAFNPRIVLSADAPVANASLAAVEAGWTCANSATAAGFEIVCDLNGTLRPRGAAYFTLNITAPNRGGTLTIRSTASASNPDPIGSNNIAAKVLRIVP